MEKSEIKPLFAIWNDGDFADNFVGCNPCQIACDIPSYEEAEEILKSDILPRFADYDPEGFFIVEDFDTVNWRLEDGETLEEIFAEATCGIFY
jgi:hypothetical protein